MYDVLVSLSCQYFFAYWYLYDLARYNKFFVLAVNAREKYSSNLKEYFDSFANCFIYVILDTEDVTLEIFLEISEKFFTQLHTSMELYIIQICSLH